MFIIHITVLVAFLIKKKKKTKRKKASTVSRTFRVKNEKQHLFKVQKSVGVSMKPTAVIVSENALRDVVA